MENKTFEKGVIIIGNKNFPVYVKAIMQTIEKDSKVTVKTRGKHIPNAINICDFLTKEKSVKIESVSICTSSFEKEGREKRVPEIEIKIIK